MSISIKGNLAATDPVKIAYSNEYSPLFLKFCSLVCIIKNKKMNMANIFLCVLKEQELRDVFKSLCEIDSDYEALKCFLDYDPTLHRSKYIRNYLQENPILNIT